MQETWSSDQTLTRLTEEGNQVGYFNVFVAMEPALHQIRKNKTLANPTQQSKWITDSGARYHVTPQYDDLTNTTTYRIGVITANTTMYSTHIGDTELIMISESEKPTKVVIKDVLYISGATFRLLFTEALILTESAPVTMTPEVHLRIIGKTRIELEFVGETGIGESARLQWRQQQASKAWGRPFR